MAEAKHLLIFCYILIFLAILIKVYFPSNSFPLSFIFQQPLFSRIFTFMLFNYFKLMDYSTMIMSEQNPRSWDCWVSLMAKTLSSQAQNPNQVQFQFLNLIISFLKSIRRIERSTERRSSIILISSSQTSSEVPNGEARCWNKYDQTRNHKL